MGTDNKLQTDNKLKSDNKLHAIDRFSGQEYLIDQKSYFHIMELIRFYHQSTYTLPDYEVIRAEKIEDPEHTINCEVPVNHLLLV